MKKEELITLHQNTPEGMFINYSGQLEEANQFEFNARKYIMGLDSINGAYALYENIENETGKAPTQFEYMTRYSALYVTHMKNIKGVEQLRGTSWGNSDAKNWNNLNEEERNAFRKFIRFRALNAWTGKEIERRAVETLKELKGESFEGYTLKDIKTDIYLDRIFGADAVLIFEDKSGNVSPLLYIGITSEKAYNNYNKKKHTTKKAINQMGKGYITYTRDMKTASRIFLTYSKKAHTDEPTYTLQALPLIIRENIRKRIEQELKNFNKNSEAYETSERCPDYQNYQTFYKLTGNGKTLNYNRKKTA